MSEAGRSDSEVSRAQGVGAGPLRPRGKQGSEERGALEAGPREVYKKGLGLLILHGRGWAGPWKLVPLSTCEEETERGPIGCVFKASIM